MDRRALRRILSDIAAGRVDAVVVYKVDRLTRSLADFAKIVEALDAKGVSFVSVTQAFNTTTSIGRLTLNVLLSFAQFEREVTGERIRDKIAASKRKGMWMGGLPSLGYDVKDRKLVINEAEAKTVRQIFRRYVALGSVRALKEELAVARVTSKRRVAANGTPYGAKPSSRGALYLMLQNRIYRGEIVHKGTVYRGEHAAIVDEDLRAEVQRTFQNNRIERRATAMKPDANLLVGLLFDAEDEPMTPTHAVKKGTRYRYYVSRRLIVGTADKSSSHGQRVPAANVEDLVIRRLRTFVADPLALLNSVSKGRLGAPLQKKLKEAAEDFSRSWVNEPSTDVIAAFLRHVLIRVHVRADRIDVEVDASRVVQFLLRNREGVWTPSPTPESSANFNADDRPPGVTLVIPAQLKRTGKELKFIIEGALEPSPPDESLVRLLTRAHALGRRLRESAGSTLEDIAAMEHMVPSYETRLLRLTYLAPDIVAAVLAGRQPVGLTANKLMADTRLPHDWREQRRALGFAHIVPQ
jgi:site-specific DNA recombinase